MDTIGKRLQAERLKKGMTQQDLATAFHTDKSTISRYESDISMPPVEVIIKLAEFFSVANDYLLTGKTPLTSEQMEQKLEIIPVYKTIHAGQQLFNRRNIAEYRNVDAALVKDGHYFYLEVKDDALNYHKIFSGDYALVRQQADVNNEEIAVVIINEEDAIIRMVQKTEAGVFFYGSNFRYKPIFALYGQFQIIGWVKKSESTVNEY